jgi:hypothetical protein
MNSDEFKKAVKDGRIRDRGYFYNRSEEEKTNIAKDMYDLTIFLKNKFDLAIYLIYGTLLGAIREKDFIPHDFDVDLAYLSKKTTKSEVLKELNWLCEEFKKEGILKQEYSNQRGWLKIYSPNKKHYVDLWTSFIINNRFYLIPVFNGEIKAQIICPFKTINFKGENFLIPNNAEKFLDIHYQDWQVPIFNFPGSKMCKRRDIL